MDISNPIRVGSNIEYNKKIKEIVRRLEAAEKLQDFVVITVDTKDLFGGFLKRSI